MTRTASPASQRDWLTIEEARTRLGLGPGGPKRIRSLITAGSLKAEKVRGLWQIDSSSLDELQSCQLAEQKLLGLVAASTAVGISFDVLKRLAEEGVISYVDRKQHGRGETIRFDLAQLQVDLRWLPRCLSAACQNPGTGQSGYCGRHSLRAARVGSALSKGALLDDQRDWLNVEEVTAILGTRRGQVIYGLVQDQKLRAERVGRALRITKASVAALLESGWEPPTEGRTSDQERHLDLLRVSALKEQGWSLGEIAEKTKQSRATVHARLADAGKVRHHASRQDRMARKQEAERLYDEGLTLEEIAGLLGCSLSTIHRILSGGVVAMRPAAPPRKYPDPEPRRCEECGDDFTPRTPSQAALRPSRFCGRKCARASHAAAKACHDAGLLTVADTAEQLYGKSKHQIGEYVRHHGLQCERIATLGGITCLAFHPDEVERFKKVLARRSDRRFLAANDPDSKAAREQNKGRPDEHVREAREQAQKHQQDRKRRRGGRPPHPAAPRWRSRLARLGADVTLRACIAIAIEDWPHHEQDWHRGKWPPDRKDPFRLREDMHKRAGERIQKVLQKPPH